LLPVFLAHFLVGFFLLSARPSLAGLRKTNAIYRLFPWSLALSLATCAQWNVFDNMNVSSKFVICLNLVSASTLLLLLSARFEWF
jgi:hypothetical protein